MRRLAFSTPAHLFQSKKDQGPAQVCCLCPFLILFFHMYSCSLLFAPQHGSVPNHPFQDVPSRPTRHADTHPSGRQPGTNGRPTWKLETCKDFYGFLHPKNGGLPVFRLHVGLFQGVGTSKCVEVEPTWMSLPVHTHTKHHPKNENQATPR